MRLRLGLVFVFLLALASCGGDGSNPDIAKVTITPSTASVSAGSTLILHGDAVGFGTSPLAGWYMQEAKGTPGGLYCGIDAGAALPTWTDCPCGYITYDTKANGPQSEAIYHAPPTAGTFHAVYQVSAHNGFIIGLTRNTQSEITVTQE